MAVAAALNPQQRAAVEHGDGPLLILAGAGTGKTRVIIERIARLIYRGVAAEHILGLTFTNKAAAQMRRRLGEVAGPAARGVTLGTFHALGLRIVQATPQAVGLRPGFAIYDTSDQLSLVRELMRQVAVADRRLDARRVLEVILAAKRAGQQEVALTWGDDYELAAYDLYPRYLAQMRAFNAIDFDDLIALSQQLLRRGEGGWAGRWRAFVVDEYQDTSADQLEIVRALSAPAHNVCAVGDDDQSIYAWRGASSGQIDAFCRSFPGAREVTLEQNYRCTPAILAAANAVIAGDGRPRHKRLWTASAGGDPVEVVACADDQDEAALVAESLLGWVQGGGRLGDCAVLYRCNQQSRAIEEALQLDRIPHRVVGGQAFYDRQEVRDVLALMAVAYEPGNEVALRRIVNTPPRGLGPQSLAHLTAWAQQRQVSLHAALAAAAEVDGLGAAARRGAASLLATLAPHRDALRRARGEAAAAALVALIGDFGLRAAVVSADDSPGLAARRLDNLAAVEDSYLRFCQRHRGARPPLGAFLAAQALGHGRGEAEGEEQGEEVTLMTLHAAKGLEFARVLLVGAEEELMPHRRAMDGDGDLHEERRLAYVGITRARFRLTICWARQRGRRGRRVPRAPSRFLAGLAGLEAVVERCRSAPEEAGDSGAAARFFAQMRGHLGLPADG